jgi:hypothetical protein
VVLLHEHQRNLPNLMLHSSPVPYPSRKNQNQIVRSQLTPPERAPFKPLPLRVSLKLLIILDVPTDRGTESV